MKLKTYFVCSLFFLISITGFSSTVKSQTAKNLAGEKIAVKKLRDLYIKRDFESCAETGKRLAEKTAVSVEAKAWTIACQSRVAEQRAEALEAAQKLVNAHGENTWSHFALAQAQNYLQKGQDAQNSIEKALQIEPDNEEFIFAKTQTLMTQKKYDEAGIYLEQNAAKIKDKSRMADSSAIILYNRAKLPAGKIDEPLKKQSFDKFAEAVKLAPRSVNANFLYGAYLNYEKRYAEALLFLKKAALLAPAATEVQREYWKAIETNQPEKTDAQKQTEVAAALNAYLISQKNSPAALYVVSQKYNEMKNDEKRDFYANQISQKYPNTKYAEAVAYDRIENYEHEASKNFDPAKMMEMLNKMAAGNATEIGKNKDLADFEKQLNESQNKLRAMRWEYVKRAQHFDDDKLGDVYYSLLHQISMDKTIPDAQFEDVVRQTLKYKKDSNINVNSNIAGVLANIKVFRPNSSLSNDAEKYARAGIAEAEEKITELGKTTTNKEALESRAKRFRSDAKAALGSVLLAAKRYDEAEKELLEAADLAGDRSFGINLDLARLYLEKKDYDKAEEHYLKNATGSDRDKFTFSRFYKTRNGNLEGFDDYFTKIKEKIHLKAKEDVLTSRIKNPKDAAPFSLQTIDGKTISLNELKGKIVVINFWGTWCPPCVIEMPQLQQLYKKYAGDKDVAIITMDTNDELETVKKFIADKKYEFPVLLGDSYTANIMFNGGIAFPTTLFIDKQGKIAFIKVSRTENLFEEFGWRIEELKK